MALQNNIIMDSGLEVQGAYVRIDTVSGYKSEIQLSVNTYVSKDSFEDGKSYLLQSFYTFSPSVEVGSDNFIKQGYEYLKSLQEYENASNVPLDGSPD